MWLIKKFIDALTLEIEAIKKGKGGGITSVQNGNLMKKICN